MTPAIGTKVQKSGRTTGYTTGVIDAVQIRISVGYGRQGVGLFVDQFRVRGDDNRAFSDRGDSGSLITTLPDNQPVGLLFAGNALANQTFANPIETVLSELNLQIAYG